MSSVKSFCHDYGTVPLLSDTISKALSSKASGPTSTDVQLNNMKQNTSLADKYRRITSNTTTTSINDYVIVLLGSTNASTPLLFDELQIITKKKCERFSTVQQSVKYIKQMRKSSVIVVLTDGKQVGGLLASCKRLAQFRAAYVLQPNTDHHTDRRVSFFRESRTLLHQIELDMFSYGREPLALNFFDLNQKTMRYLSQENASFVWTHMLIDVLKLFPSHEYAINDIINMCRQCYREQPAQLDCIDQFGNTYTADTAIEWYTRDCFLYRVLNKALRTEDADALYIFRAVIVDLCAQIEEKHRTHHFPQSIITVYRGQLMFKWELNKLRENIGQLISVNAFFSASYNENVATIFAGNESTDSSIQSVLFEIELDTRLQHTLAAPIDHLDHSDGEVEILFSLCSVFEVTDVVRENQCWRVRLRATDTGREFYDEYKQLELLDEECPTVDILFGRLLTIMGHHNKALRYFTLLHKRLETLNENSLAAIICGESQCFYEMGEFSKARQCAKNGTILLAKQGMTVNNVLYLRCRYHLGNSLALMYKVKEARIILEETLRDQLHCLHGDHIHIADTLKSLGRVQGYEEGFDKALQLRSDALEIFKKVLSEKHPKCTEAIVSLAGSYRVIGQFSTALSYLESANRIQEQFLINEHSLRASTLRETGLVYEALGDFTTAFDYYCQAYSIWMYQYPDGHVYAAFCLNKIGGVYRTRKQFQQALDCQTYAIQMHAGSFKKGTRHPVHELAKTYLDMGNNKKAIETFRLACAYWRTKTKNPTHIDLCAAKRFLASAYSHAGQYKRAQKLFEQVLALQKSSRPDGNPETGYTLHHMGSNFVRLNDFHSALKHYTDSVNMLSKFFSNDHPEMARIRTKIELVQMLMQN